MKKFILLVSLFMVFGLVSCGEETTTEAAGTETTTAEATTAEPVELSMVWWNDGTEGQVMQGLLDQYETETGVVITMTDVPYNDYEANLATNIAGGEVPDLGRVTEGHMNNFQDHILGLNDVFDTTGFANIFFNDEGQALGLPLDVTANGMYVNTTLLDANGVVYPDVDGSWTWSEFYTEMSKLDGATGVAAPGLFDHQGHRFMSIIYQAGITIWDEPYTSTNLTDPDVVDQVSMIMDWYDEGFLSEDTYTAFDSASLFKSGQYGFHMSGSWNVSGYDAAITTFDWAVVPMPSGVTRATILGGKALCAFDGSGNEDAAKAFIEWFAEPEQHDAFTEGVPFLTPRIGAVVDYGDLTTQYNVFLSEIAATSQAATSDWLTQVMIPGMYPIINDFAEKVALSDDTALKLLQDLEAALIAAAAE